MRYVTLFLCLFLLFPWPVKAANGGGASAPAAGQASGGMRQGTQASLPAEARCGETVQLTADQPPLPGGTAYAGVQVSWTQRPEGREPDVLPGFPVSDIRFHVPGRYVCTVSVGYVSKGTCAGAAWHERGTHTLEIQVLQSSAASARGWRLFALVWGEGGPLALLSMPVRPYGLTGTALRAACWVAAGAGGPSLFAAEREKAFSSSFPPRPPSLPQRAFIRRSESVRGDPHPKQAARVRLFFFIS